MSTIAGSKDGGRCAMPGWPSSTVFTGEDMNLTLLTGKDALERVNSTAFQAKWRELYAGCPWAVASLHPDFVATWYRLYQPQFLPVIVLAEAKDGALGGLMTLALHPSGNKLSGAGDQQAEYHGWIEAADVGSRFIVDAIRAIRTMFPRADICLKYLPPGIPLGWMEEEGNDRGCCALRSHARPVMKIDPAAMDRQRNKKNHRQNVNRLKRLGELRFQRVIEHEHFNRVFDEICNQYDFRQAALYRSMPFASDPAKKRFYLELHKLGLLHVTVLTVGEAVAASHIGLLSEERAVHLGINTYDPALAAHSPGNLLLAMLGVQLAAEQMPMLDLTPGGDGYKEHFATEHDAARELTIYRDRGRRVRMHALSSVARYAKTRLRMAGYRPADVLAMLGRAKGVRPVALGELLGKLRSRAHARHCELRYRPGAPQARTEALPISRNRLHDILKFDARASSAEFRAFSATVMKRMERCNDLYCYVQDDQLRMFCWTRVDTPEPAAQQCQPGPAASDGSVVLFDLYVHHQVTDKRLVQGFIEQILRALGEQKKALDVRYRGALDAELQAVVERCGFVDAAG